MSLFLFAKPIQLLLFDDLFAIIFVLLMRNHFKVKRKSLDTISVDERCKAKSKQTQFLLNSQFKKNLSTGTVNRLLKLI